jgi:hypothetical protein
MLTTRFGESGTVQENAETGRENGKPPVPLGQCEVPARG